MEAMGGERKWESAFNSRFCGAGLSNKAIKEDYQIKEDEEGLSLTLNSSERITT